MIAVRLTPDLRWSVLGAPAYFAARGRPRTPEELTRHECIRYRFLTAGSIYRWEFERGGREFSVDVPGGVTVNDGTLMMSLALKGMGLIYTADLFAARELAAGQLEPVLEEFLPKTPGLVSLFPRAHADAAEAARVHRHADRGEQASRCQVGLQPDAVGDEGATLRQQAGDTNCISLLLVAGGFFTLLAVLGMLATAANAAETSTLKQYDFELRTLNLGETSRKGQLQFNIDNGMIEEELDSVRRVLDQLGASEVDNEGNRYLSTANGTRVKIGGFLVEGYLEDSVEGVHALPVEFTVKSEFAAPEAALVLRIAAAGNLFVGSSADPDRVATTCSDRRSPLLQAPQAGIDHAG